MRLIVRCRGERNVSYHGYIWIHKHSGGKHNLLGYFSILFETGKEKAVSAFAICMDVLAC